MVIALISGSAVTVGLWQSRTLPAGSWYFVMAVINGMILGRLLAPRLPARQIQLVFALLCLVAASIVLLQAAGLIKPFTHLYAYQCTAPGSSLTIYLPTINLS